MFPNLSVIRGQNLFSSYSLVIWEMHEMKEIGLHSLKDILLGSVRIEKNDNLCFTNTIDWDLIASAGRGGHVIKKFDAVEDQQSSQSYIIKLLTVSVSTIAYLKNLYNEDDYAEFFIKGGNCKILKVKSENPDCKHLLGLLKGAFDAVRNQYLRELVLGIYTNPRDREGSFVESFNFLFEYGDGNHVTLSYKPNGEGKVSSKKKINRKDVNRISKDLLDVLHSFCSNTSFSGKKEYLTMKFYYYPNTPGDYQPPGFRRANEKEYNYLKQSKSNAAIIANVETPWHSLGVGRPAENQPKNIHEQDTDNIPRTKIENCNENDLTLDLKKLVMSPKANVTLEFGTVKYPATDAEPVAALGGQVDKVVSSNPASPIVSLIQDPEKDIRRRRKISYGNPAHSSYFGRKRLEKSSTNNFTASGITYNVNGGMAAAFLKSPDLKKSFVPSMATPKSDAQSFTPQRFSAVNALFEMRCRYPAHINSAALSPVTTGPFAEPETAVQKDLIATGPLNPSPTQYLIDDGTIIIKCICESKFVPEMLLYCRFCETQQHPICYGFQLDQATVATDHVCVECSKNHDFYTAVDLKDLSNEEIRSVALHRLVLNRVFLQDARELNVAEEAAALLIPLDVVQQAISQLEEFGAFRKKKARGSRGIYYINRDKASKAFFMFFHGETSGLEEGEQSECRKGKGEQPEKGRESSQKRKLSNDRQSTKKLKLTSSPKKKANTLMEIDFSCE